MDPEITALLISREIQRKFLLVSLLLIGFPPRAQQLASRKPTCAGPTQILLFYYFLTITILRILREIGSLHLENPPVPVGPRISRFTDFARNQEKIPLSLFTFNGISSTASAVYISKTHLCRLDPDFTILLFYYFTIFARNHLPLHVGPQESLHLENLPWHVGPPICMSDRGIP